jgi:hypothetical protein
MIGKPVHDQEASIVSLAKTLRMSIDPNKDETKVRTASLLLLLDNFIAKFEPHSHQKIAEISSRNVKEMVRHIEAETQKRNLEENARKDEPRELSDEIYSSQTDSRLVHILDR